MDFLSGGCVGGLLVLKFALDGELNGILFGESGICGLFELLLLLVLLSGNAL